MSFLSDLADTHLFYACWIYLAIKFYCLPTTTTLETVSKKTLITSNKNPLSNQVKKLGWNNLQQDQNLSSICFFQKRPLQEKPTLYRITWTMTISTKHIIWSGFQVIHLYIQLECQEDVLPSAIYYLQPRPAEVTTVFWKKVKLFHSATMEGCVAQRVDPLFPLETCSGLWPVMLSYCWKSVLPSVLRVEACYALRCVSFLCPGLPGSREVAGCFSFWVCLVPQGKAMPKGECCELHNYVSWTFLCCKHPFFIELEHTALTRFLILFPALKSKGKIEVTGWAFYFLLSSLLCF